MSKSATPAVPARGVPGALAMLALHAIRRRDTVLAPPAVALLCGVGAPVLHAVWMVLAMPWPLAHGIAALGALLAWSCALHRRAGLPRLLALAAWASAVAWVWAVWTLGPSIAAYRWLVALLCASWPIWTWWCWRRGRRSVVQDSESHWSVVRGPSLRIPALARISKKVRRWRNRREHRRVQARREQQRLARRGTA